MIRKTLTLLLVVWLTSPGTLWAVVVWQTEADGNSITSGIQYAAVEFGGNSSMAAYGTTFYALSSTTNSYSGHAHGVAIYLLGQSGSYVDAIYADTYQGLYNKVVYAGTGPGGYYYTSIPAATPYSIKIVNNSWISSSTGVAVAAQVRTLDYLIARDDLIMCSGAVSSGGMAWGMRNGLSVRGTQGFTATPIENINRLRPDLWGVSTSIASSYATPQVAGVAAQIVGRSQDYGWADSQRHEVVKSILMTGTSKTPSGSFIAWNPTLPNNLDTEDGAGQLVPSIAYDVFEAGQKALTSLSSTAMGTPILSPSITTASQGWSYISSLSEYSQVALIMHRETPFEALTATLAWDVVPPTVTGMGGPRLDTSTDLFPNLNLTLYTVSEVGGNYFLGSPVGLAGLTSNAVLDNVEHLYFPGTLPAGYYAFVIDYVDSPSVNNYATDAGFSFTLTPVPEPSTFALLAVLAAAVLMVRRRTARGTS